MSLVSTKTLFCRHKDIIRLTFVFLRIFIILDLDKLFVVDLLFDTYFGMISLIRLRNRLRLI